MRCAVLLLGLFIIPNLYASKSCDGKKVDCFNAESQKWETYNNADSCQDYYDFGWKTKPYCSEDSNPSLCSGKSVDCFDAETQKWKTFKDSNTCNDYYDSGWKTEGLCK